MSTKQNDELREIVAENLVEVIKNAKEILTLQDMGEVLAKCYSQEEADALAKDISAINLPIINLDVINSINKAIRS